MYKLTIAGIEVNSFYLSKKQLEEIGKQKTCLKCNQPFIIGAAEFAKYSKDYKGKEKRFFELFTDDVLLIWDKVKRILVKETFNGKEIIVKKNLTIDFESLATKELAVLFGIEDINIKLCPVCYADNKLQDDDVFTLQGKPDAKYHGVCDLEV